MQLKGFRAIKMGPVPVAGPLLSLIGPSIQRPSVPLTGPFQLSNCRSQFPGFNRIGPLGASGNFWSWPDLNLGGFKKALGVFSVEAPKPDSGSFSGRFGSDSGGLPGCNSDFWSVMPTCGL